MKKTILFLLAAGCTMPLLAMEPDRVNYMSQLPTDAAVEIIVQAGTLQDAIAIAITLSRSNKHFLAQLKKADFKKGLIKRLSEQFKTYDISFIKYLVELISTKYADVSFAIKTLVSKYSKFLLKSHQVNAVVNALANMYQQAPVLIALMIYSAVSDQKQKNVIKRWLSKNKATLNYSLKQIAAGINIPGINAEKINKEFKVLISSDLVSYIVLINPQDIKEKDFDKIMKLIKLSGADLNEGAIYSPILSEVARKIAALEGRSFKLRAQMNFKTQSEQEKISNAMKLWTNAMNLWKKIALMLMNSGARPSGDAIKILKTVGIKHPALEKKKK